MTVRQSNPGFLPEAPIYDELLEADPTSGAVEITDPWRNWFNAVTRVMGNVITHDVLLDPFPPATPLNQQNVFLLELPNYKEADRDKLQNARNGTAIYNLDTNRVNFRENNAWVTFTAVPA